MSLNPSMVYSKTGLQLTENFEGCRLTAYRDVKGVLTVGFGHTGPDVTEGLTITQDQANLLLEKDMAWAEAVVNNYVDVQLTQSQFNAIVDLVFNIGSGNFRNSTMLKLLNSEQYALAAEEFQKWDKAGGLVVAGLLRRRESEENEFQSQGV
jgi:lysozyme